MVFTLIQESKESNYGDYKKNALSLAQKLHFLTLLHMFGVNYLNIQKN